MFCGKKKNLFLSCQLQTKYLRQPDMFGVALFYLVFWGFFLARFDENKEEESFLL